MCPLHDSFLRYEHACMTYYRVIVLLINIMFGSMFAFTSVYGALLLMDPVVKYSFGALIIEVVVIGGLLMRNRNRGRVAVIASPQKHR